MKKKKSQVPWTQEEDTLLKKLYLDPETTRDRLEKSFPKHPWSSIIAHALRKKWHRPPYWTKERVALLEEIYSKPGDIREELKKAFPEQKYSACCWYARHSKFNRPVYWTKERLALLKEIYSKPGDIREEMKKAFPEQSYAACYVYARSSGFFRPKAEPKPELKPESLPQEDLEEKVTEQLRSVFGEEFPVPKRLPQLSSDKPFVIENGEVTVINSPLIGSLSAEDEKFDMVKNSLRIAEAAKHVAVLITGDLIYMPNQRYGTLRPYKAQVSGVKVDPKKVEAAYPAYVVKDPKFQMVERRLEKGELVFMTLSLRFDHNIEMVAKTFTDKNGKPLYNGPVLITFGKLEDELIRFLANELMRGGWAATRAWAHKRILALTDEWKKLSDKQTKAAEEEDKEEVARIQGEKDLLSEAIEDFREWLHIWALMNNIADESLNSARQAVTTYLIRKYEKCIPNAKVISVGDSYIKLGSKLIMVTTDKDREGFKGQLAPKLGEKTESFSKGHNPERIPNAILGMGLNPCFRTNFVTLPASKEPGDKRMVPHLQLPILIDAERFRNVIRGQNILKDIITRVVRQSGFESGILSLRWEDDVPMPVITSWRNRLLKNPENFTPEGLRDLLDLGTKEEKKKRAEQRKKHKLLFRHKEGCTHIGWNEQIYLSPDNPDCRFWIHHHQVGKEILLRNNAPISSYGHDGDSCNMANHSYWKKKHPEYLRPEQFARVIKKLKSSNMSDAEKFKALAILALRQRYLGATYQFDEQVRAYVDSCEPYLEYFIRILQLSKKLGLELGGTLKTIIQIIGNHNKNTFKISDISVSDANAFIEQIKGKLLKYLIDHNLTDLADDVIRELAAPQYGELGEAQGTFGIPGFQTYSLVLKHKQGNGNATQKRANRRVVDGPQVSCPVLNESGDDHRGEYRETRDMVLVKTGSQQADYDFGHEIDFSEQNRFFTVYGIPVGGFAWGPTVYVTIDEEMCRRWALKPFPIDSEKIFRYALK